eukprot:7598948-Ditylum_brightwellii.AAC.1
MVAGNVLGDVLGAFVGMALCFEGNNFIDGSLFAHQSLDVGPRGVYLAHTMVVNLVKSSGLSFAITVAV